MKNIYEIQASFNTLKELLSYQETELDFDIELAIVNDILWFLESEITLKHELCK